MTRSRFVPWAISALMLTGCARPAGLMSAAGAGRPLVEPSPLADLASDARTVEVSLTAERQTLSLIGGRATTAYTYNGALPGPTLELTEGDQVVVHFTNRLAEATNVHWHGLMVPPDQDGDPSEPVAPGESRDYRFVVPPGSAGTHWYHPHVRGASAQQMASGLFGAIRVRAAEDPVPAGVVDTVLVLSDHRFDGQGAIPPYTPEEYMDGREGEYVFVNGQLAPVVAVRAGELRRWRLVNASTARYYRLRLAGHAFWQIGTDGGLIERPVRQDELLLAPGERAEVLVKADGEPGGTAWLEAHPYERGRHHPAPGTAGLPTGAHHHYRVRSAGGAPVPILKVAYAADAPVAGPVVPASLGRVAPLPTEGATARAIRFAEDHMQLRFLLNGQAYDPARVDFRGAPGATELWELSNQGDMDHPFHVQGARLQVVARDGAPPPFSAWKDTLNVRPQETVKVAVRFEGGPGRRTYQCQIAEHADMGMMGQIEITPTPDP